MKLSPFLGLSSAPSGCVDVLTGSADSRHIPVALVVDADHPANGVVVCVGMALGAMRSVFLAVLGCRCVIRRSNGLKVIGIDAFCVLTQMVNLVSVWYLTFVELVSQTMRLITPTVEPNTPIGIFGIRKTVTQRPSPFSAISNMLNMVSEQIVEREPCSWRHTPSVSLSWEYFPLFGVEN